MATEENNPAHKRRKETLISDYYGVPAEVKTKTEMAKPFKSDPSDNYEEFVTRNDGEDKVDLDVDGKYACHKHAHLQVNPPVVAGEHFKLALRARYQCELSFSFGIIER